MTELGLLVILFNSFFLIGSLVPTLITLRFLPWLGPQKKAVVRLHCVYWLGIDFLIIVYLSFTLVDTLTSSPSISVFNLTLTLSFLVVKFAVYGLVLTLLTMRQHAPRVFDFILLGFALQIIILGGGLLFFLRPD